MFSNILKIIGWLSLVVLIGPSLMFLAGSESMSLETLKTYMISATAAWFVAEGLRWKLERSAATP